MMISRTTATYFCWKVSKKYSIFGRQPQNNEQVIVAFNALFMLIKINFYR